MALMGSIFAVTVISSAVIMGIALANIQGTFVFASYQNVRLTVTRLS